MRRRIFSSGSLLEVAYLDAFGADVDPFRVAFDNDTHLLQVRKESAHGPAGDLAACAALGFILALAGH